MLKSIHAGKANMLHGDAFADKVAKLKKKILDEEKLESNEKLGLNNQMARIMQAMLSDR